MGDLQSGRGIILGEKHKKSVAAQGVVIFLNNDNFSFI